MRNLTLFFKYIKYRLSAKTRYDVHSPFLFAFIEEVLRKKGNYYAYEKVEASRKMMRKDPRLIDVEDLGAGSRIMMGSKRKVSDIARHSLMPVNQAQLIHRIAARFKPSSALELGTSLGITSMYLSCAYTEGKVITVEGSRAIHEIALENFKRNGIRNIEAVNASFDDFLKEYLSKHPTPELVLIDGNHQQDATLRYFELLMKNAPPHCILLFDDIHWSEGMEAAWEKIIADPRVTLSLDLFHTGVVFLRKESKKEHYILKY